MRNVRNGKSGPRCQKSDHMDNNLLDGGRGRFAIEIVVENSMTRVKPLNSGNGIEDDLEEFLAGSRDEHKVPGIGCAQLLETFDWKAESSEIGL